MLLGLWVQWVWSLGDAALHSPHTLYTVSAEVLGQLCINQVHLVGRLGSSYPVLSALCITKFGVPAGICVSVSSDSTT